MKIRDLFPQMQGRRRPDGVAASGGRPGRAPERGAGLLSIVTGMGVIAALVQGSLYYQARTSNTFIISEGHKTLAREMAEAGIEANIADIGQRSLYITEGMEGVKTYDNEPLGSGSYTTSLTAAGTGSEQDTVDLVSTGNYRDQSLSISARLKVRKYQDTSSTISMIIDIDTVTTITTSTVADSTVTITEMDPDDMPPLDTQPAYEACMASSDKKCDICHLPGGNPDNVQFKSISKSAIDQHISHHGDYISTDGTCDLYDPVETIVVTMVTVDDTTVAFDTTAVFDTALTVTERAKVRVLTWK